MKYIKPLLLFVAVVAFFVLTLPANHSEAEDACFYAQMAEQGGLSDLFHAHHLLYLPLMSLLFRGVAFFGYAGRALPVLIGFSMLSGAAAICLFVALASRKRSNLFFAAALLFSYGFWRYSTTAEIYMPVAALSLLALYCARRSEERPLFFWGSALAAAAALLMHVIAWPLVLVALPVFYIASGRPGRAVGYLGLVLIVTATAYVAAISGPGLTVFSDAQAVRGTLASPGTWLKGVVAWGQNVGSGNFFFAIEPIAKKIQAAFPHHMLQEEMFMGQAAPGWIGWVAPFTFLGVLVAMGTVLFIALRNVRRVLSAEWIWPAVLLIWLGGTAGTALLFEPSNPEMWICTLPPFWLLLSVFFDGIPAASSTARWIPGGLAFLLLIHNAVGGMSLVASPKGDYCRQKTKWIATEARAGDAVLMAESHATITFLQYRTAAQVVDAKFIDPETWQGLKKQTTGRIFIFGDVLKLLPSVAHRAPESVRKIRQTAELFKSNLKRVHVDALGTVYQWL